MPTVQDRWINKVVGGNRYLVSEKLGEGGMGTVYLAEDRNLQNWVVIKTPHPSMLRDPEFAARFKREVRSLVALSHPHIVKVLDVGQHGDVPFAVMEFLAGGSLESRLFGNGAESQNAVWQSPPLVDVCEWLTQIAAALDFIHGKGFIHRDVKPANILFDQSSHACLTDFGVAKVLAQVESSPKPKLTATGTILGTAEYMAPELLQGKLFDHRIDQYALAVTLFEALSGTRPYDGGTPAAIALAQVQQAIPRLHERVAGVSKELSRVLSRSLAHSPDDRFCSCSEFAAAVRQAMEQTTQPSSGWRHTLGNWFSSGSAPPSEQVASRSEVTPTRDTASLRGTQPTRDHVPKSNRSTARKSKSLAETRRLLSIRERLRADWRAASGRSRAAIVGGVLLLCAISLSLLSHRVPHNDPLVTNGTKPDPSPLSQISNDSPPIPKTFEGGKANVERDDNGLKMKLVWCPPGTFTMGSPKDEADRYDDEDQVSVTLSLGFWMGKFEVTQGEWSQVMETSVAQQQEKQNGIDRVSVTGARHPMCFVAHGEATEFCFKLAEQERRSGRLPMDWEYRLPSEAQWEYACRAGTTTATAFGNSLSSTLANFDGSRPYGTAVQGKSWRSTTEVGSYQPNDWGLFDMHGNVYEWTSDRYLKSLPGGRDPDVRQGSEAAGAVYRGGSWNFGGKMCRSAHRRFGVVPDFQRGDIGFRVAAVQSAPNSTTSDPESNEATPISEPVNLPNAPTTASQGVPPKNTSKDAEPIAPKPSEFTNSIGMTLKLIPAGEFDMGSSDTDLEADLRAARRADPDFTGEYPKETEQPQHHVRITQPFYIGIHEVTQEQYETVAGTNPSWCSPSGRGKLTARGQDTRRFPVEHVSWFDAVEFCNKLSTRENRTPYYRLTNIERNEGSITKADAVTIRGNGYRLPTEAEWEYACRAGTKSLFNFGNVLNGDKANVDGNCPFGTTTKGTYLKRTTRVGSYGENAFGLFDMHGNVSEWCEDVYDRRAYASRSGTTSDPKVTTGSESRVVRGGYFLLAPTFSRTAYRSAAKPDFRNNSTGFRVLSVGVGVRTP